MKTTLEFAARKLNREARAQAHRRSRLLTGALVVASLVVAALLLKFVFLS